jgi:hypothetical protein
MTTDFPSVDPWLLLTSASFVPPFPAFFEHRPWRFQVNRSPSISTAYSNFDFRIAQISHIFSYRRTTSPRQFRPTPYSPTGSQLLSFYSGYRNTECNTSLCHAFSYLFYVYILNISNQYIFYIQLLYEVRNLILFHPHLYASTIIFIPSNRFTSTYLYATETHSRKRYAF